MIEKGFACADHSQLPTLWAHSLTDLQSAMSCGCDLAKASDLDLTAAQSCDGEEIPWVHRRPWSGKAVVPVTVGDYSSIPRGSCCYLPYSMCVEYVKGTAVASGAGALRAPSPISSRLIVSPPCSPDR